MKKQRKTYSEAFKKQVVEEVLQGKLTKEAARQKYGIRGNSEILYWIRKAEGAVLQWISPIPLQIMQKKKAGKTPNHTEAPEQDIEQLRNQLWLAELKVESLDRMIDIAEKELKISIRKKSGTKQSMKSKANTKK
jgi:transposase